MVGCSSGRASTKTGAVHCKDLAGSEAGDCGLRDGDFGTCTTPRIANANRLVEPVGIAAVSVPPGGVVAGDVNPILPLGTHHLLEPQDAGSHGRSIHASTHCVKERTHHKSRRGFRREAWEHVARQKPGA